MSKKAESQVVDVVVSYMTKQNRPYSLVDIFNNLHNKHSKTTLQKALDQLVGDKKICEKSYGKQKVYVVNQELMTAVSDVELKSMDSKISDLNSELKEMTKAAKDAELEFQRVSCSLSTPDAKSQAEALTKELEILDQKLRTLAENPNLVTLDDKKEITTSREKYVKEWRKRRRCADDMLNAILEGYPKSKKALYEEVGVETDDDVGIKLPL